MQKIVAAVFDLTSFIFTEGDTGDTQEELMDNLKDAIEGWLVVASESYIPTLA